MHARIDDVYCWIFGAVGGFFGGLFSLGRAPSEWSPRIGVIGLLIFVFPFVRRFLQRRRLAKRGVDVLAKEEACGGFAISEEIAPSILVMDLGGRTVRVKAWVPQLAVRQPELTVRVDPANPRDFYFPKIKPATPSRPSSPAERRVAIIGIVIAVIGVATVAYIYR